MKILLTGAQGFIGSYFQKKYTTLYDFIGFSFRSHNINDINFYGIECVIHLSALVHQMHGASENAYEKVNVLQTIELAKEAKAKNVKHFIFMSSIKVYGEESVVIYNEKTSCHPKDAYGKSKLKAEQLLQELEDENFKVSIIRTPIVYGYGIKANIKNLISLVNKIPLLPFGDIQNKRSMVYIGNLCHLIDEIIKQEKPGIFLASDDNTLSTTQLIKLISKYLHKEVFLFYLPLFPILLKFLKPSFYNRLYGSLEVNNIQTKNALKLINPYSIEDGMKYMIHGEK